MAGLLTAAEERSLAEAVARGDRAARQRMIEANIGLVHTIALHFRGKGLDLDDLVAEGTLGLIHAVKLFDPAVGTRFGTYAGYWIKQAMRNAIITTRPTVRLPNGLFYRLTRWRAVERELTVARGHPPDPAEVDDVMGLTPQQRRLAARARALRLAPMTEDWEPSTGPDLRLDQADLLDGVRWRLRRLTDREQRIVSLRYGLDGPPQTGAAVGRAVGLSRQRTDMILRLAVARLRELCGAEGGRT